MIKLSCKHPRFFSLIILCYLTSCVTAEDYHVQVAENQIISCHSELVVPRTSLLMIFCELRNRSTSSQGTPTSLLPQKNQAFAMLNEDQFFSVLNNLNERNMPTDGLAGYSIAFSGTRTDHKVGLLLGYLGIKFLQIGIDTSDDTLLYGLDFKQDQEKLSKTSRAQLVEVARPFAHPKSLRFCNDQNLKKCVDVPLQPGVSVVRSRRWEVE